jgi:hypothetical protein
VHFLKGPIEFEEKSLKVAIKRAQEILKERKIEAIKHLDRLVKGEDPLLSITELEKEELIKQYPTKVNLIEIKTYVIDVI